ncbi:MAG: hypothetical protein ACLURV_08485 [Gallintestinimicrobium sp.]
MYSSNVSDKRLLFRQTLDYEFSYGDEIVVTPRKFRWIFAIWENAMRIMG